MIGRDVLTGVNAATLLWLDGCLVDWSNVGRILYPVTDGKLPQNMGKYGYSYNFDSCIISRDSQYIFLYQNLGTKGLLLRRNGDIIREINRSYYHADVYEYPVAFLSYNDKSYLIHCPHSYAQLDFEDIETGEIITAVKGREPADFFHSRLEVSPDNKHLLSKGWIWHPADSVRLFNIEACFNDPLELDKPSVTQPEANADISTACFITDNHILLGCPPFSEVYDDEVTDILTERQIGVWDIIEKKMVHIVSVGLDFGNLYPIGKHYVWDLYKYPKIIDIRSGKVVSEIDEIYSGTKCSSIIHHLHDLPLMAFDYRTKSIAILHDRTLNILTPRNRF
ncbi:hypothetical protein M2451_003922 [Dysgonomonas sp. PFB1-18]|uniref:hypothetical protein n=1 Tax=unclassified Dysgonomonas TaxID=2630389 RepID=UPI0024746720|nr:MULTISPECIES: hypothetical protein [unclassified Dysgonomonas]MDH6311033.1 hypothetical protein [Dysgonomonas sp. PF1-14]MDH6337882.1 hypothetical protein [Dysgonomonas sp. PF1-16]MDH6382581.1 hypothetical protein [Dysgonomonas sp. PFB1-18]MDH6398014.1 hypothetical protein [Dysgonomonas sp. PF1-23]